MSWPRLLQRRVCQALLATILLTGCGGKEVVDANARPIVERLEQSTSPTRWTFEYVTLAASPYVACLGGVDEVVGAVDLDTGVLSLQPARAAPPVLVTESSTLVPEPAGLGWREVALDDIEGEQLTAVFGEVLAGFIRDGIHRPDMNMTALAAIDIASAVSLTVPPYGLRGDAILIELDQDRYVAELAANAPTPPADVEPEIAPSITVVVDPMGLVTALAVTVDGGTHGDGYVMTASYANAPAIPLPARADRLQSHLDDLNYPAAQESCRLGS